MHKHSVLVGMHLTSIVERIQLHRSPEKFGSKQNAKMSLMLAAVQLRSGINGSISACIDAADGKERLTYIL